MNPRKKEKGYDATHLGKQQKGGHATGTKGSRGHIALKRCHVIKLSYAGHGIHIRIPLPF